jgi:ClpP class serine protease
MSERRLYDWALSQPWAILPDVLEQGLAIALRQGDGPQAVAERLGRPLENAHKVTIREGGVAVIPVVGPIFPRANLFTEISGATSIDVLAQDLRTAADDPGVRSIVLDIDSPGGQVTGVAELANRIRSAAGKKPIIGYASGTLASGAYWLGSAADALILSPTTAAGSIGVVTGMRRPDPKDDTIEIVSSLAPNKRVDVSTDAGRAEVQRVVDDLHDVFERAVAQHRGVSVERVRSDFGRGGVLIGAKAVAAGMADKVGDFESLVSELAQGRVPGRVSRKGNSMSIKDKVYGFLAGLPDEPDEPKVPPPDEPPVPQPRPQPTPSATIPQHDTLSPVERAELDAYRKAKKQADLDAIGFSAIAFANAQMKDRKVTPAESATVATIHANLALAKAGIAAEAAWDGDVAGGGRIAIEPKSGASPVAAAVALFEGMFAGRSSLAAMFEEQVDARPVSPVNPANNPHADATEAEFDAKLAAWKARQNGHARGAAR